MINPAIVAFDKPPQRFHAEGAPRRHVAPKSRKLRKDTLVAREGRGRELVP